jgi:isocitrate dehydrogenase (NAD+)
MGVSMRTVIAMPGDGIGKVVLPEALRVLDAVGFEAEYVHGDIGWEFWCREGDALPERTVELLDRHELGLFGAITSKPKDEAAAELDPQLQGRGHVYYSPIVGLRQRFDLDVCIRPCRSFPGNPLNFVRQGIDGGMEEPEVDVAIFRQNTEGLYAGIEWTDPPAQVLDALRTHPKFARFADTPGPDLAISTRVFTRNACRRIMRAAFEYAVNHGYRSVTVCEKPNVLRETSGMMEEEARRVHADFPDIQLWSTNIDAQMMWLTKNPEDYGVIVAGNMFGDIVSDGFAGLVGGLGFACSGNIGDRVAVFEPTHGSAPKYEALDPPIVNPIAMILSAAMLLDHVGETDRARRVRDAVGTVVREGQVRTYDMMRIPGGPDSIRRGAATTSEVTDAIIAALGASVSAGGEAGS